MGGSFSYFLLFNPVLILGKWLPPSQQERCVCVLSCSVVSNSSATSRTIACQAPLSLEFSRQEYRSRLSFLCQGIFLTQESDLCLLCLLHLAGRFFTTHCAIWEAPIGKIEIFKWKTCSSFAIKSKPFYMFFFLPLSCLLWKKGFPHFLKPGAHPFSPYRFLIFL